MSSERAFRWAGILASFFTAQGLVQGASILAGLLFVNFMSIREFALYTLATSFLSSFVFLTDLGSSSSLFYFFHKLRTQNAFDTFPEYVAAVYGLRRAAFWLVTAVIALLFCLSARAEAFPWADVTLSGLALFAGAYLQVGASLGVLILRLLDKYRQSYRAELLGAFTRLALASLLVAFATVQAWLALAAGALATAVTAAATASAARPVGMALLTRRREILRYLLPTLPGALYFSIQGPLIVWLAATFAGTQQIAEVGALGRLGLIVSLLSGLSGAVFLPHLARLQDDGIYLRRYLQFGIALALLAGGLVATVAIVPKALLWLIGSKYAALERELALVVIAAGLSLLDGYAVGVNNARSWTRLNQHALAVLVLVQVIGVILLPLDSTANVLLYAILCRVTSLGSQLLIATAGFARPAVVLWH